MSNSLYAQKHAECVITLHEFFRSISPSLDEDLFDWIDSMANVPYYRNTYEVCASMYYALAFQVNTLTVVMLRKGITNPPIEVTKAILYLRALYWESHCWSAFRHKELPIDDNHKSAWSILLCVSPLVYSPE